MLSGVILLPVLLPVSATDIGSVSTSNGTFNDLDKLSIGHVQVSHLFFFSQFVGGSVFGSEIDCVVVVNSCWTLLIEICFC